MSTIYVLEPPTKGKVVLNTTHGPLDIELWPKEAPKAVRNFVQLCLEGCYHNTIFHRIIKGFLIQGGDPTGTGTGTYSLPIQVFHDLKNQRILPKLSFIYLQFRSIEHRFEYYLLRKKIKKNKIKLFRFVQFREKSFGIR